MKKDTQHRRKSKGTNSELDRAHKAPPTVALAVDEPTGIDRDFIHLWNTARFGLNAALIHGVQHSPDDIENGVASQVLRSELIRRNPQQDTLGVAPYAPYDKAFPREYTPTPDLQTVLDKWVDLYLQRVDTIAHRWKEETDAMNEHLSALGEQVRSWEPYAGFTENATPDIRTIAESAQRKIVEGITAKINMQAGRNGTNAVQRMEWKGNTIEFVTIVQNLAKSGYIDLPSRNGKGDGNETELFRRLQQLFVVRNGKGEEITPELVKNRAAGRPMGEARAKEFELPEATPSRAK